MAGIVDGDTRARSTSCTASRTACVERDGHLRWDIDRRCTSEVLDRPRALAPSYPDVESIGIDTWGVDYGLLDADGNLLADPIAYRDDRTEAVIDDGPRPHQPDELYRINGAAVPAVQHRCTNSPPNSAATAGTAPRTSSLLPDLLAFWLTGELRTEYTNATTTGLVDMRHAALVRRTCSTRLGIPARLLPPLQNPDRPRHRASECARDRARAVDGRDDRRLARHRLRGRRRPATTDRFAYVSSGTWSLVGLELDAPIAHRRRAGRQLHQRGRSRRPHPVPAQRRRSVAAAGVRARRGPNTASRRPGRSARRPPSLPAGGPTFDVDDPTFIAARRHARRASRRDRGARRAVPATPRENVSLHHRLAGARAYATTIAAAAAGAGDVEIVHIVGGGSQNELLCQLTADAHRAAGRRRPGRGDRARQRARASPHARCAAALARRAPRARRVDDTAPSLRKQLDEADPMSKLRVVITRLEYPHARGRTRSRHSGAAIDVDRYDGQCRVDAGGVRDRGRRRVVRARRTATSRSSWPGPRRP